MQNRQERKPIILIICNYYLPGYKAGGGLRTLVHMVERFNEKFDFRVIALDHDTDRKTYNCVKLNDWNEVQGAKVFYISDHNVKLSKLRRLIQKTNPDSIYLNSFFSKLTVFVLILKKLNLIPNVKIILAPEGELANGALQLKSGKKKIFMKFARHTDLYKNLIWKAATEFEKQEIKRIRNRNEEIIIAPNMPAKFLLKNYRQDAKPKKTSGEVKIIFLSRIMKTKNIDWLINNLKGVKGKLEIDVFGPIEDEDYWRETQSKISRLPENIKVVYKGALAYEDVLDRLFEYHFFVLPTLGENFGHIFIEALAAGCPLIISDKTPWLNLSEKEIGWDISLEKPDEWIKVINECIEMNDLRYRKISARARDFAYQWLSSPEVEENTLNVLNYGLGIKSANQAKEIA